MCRVDCNPVAGEERLPMAVCKHFPVAVILGLNVEGLEGTANGFTIQNARFRVADAGPEPLRGRDAAKL